MIFRSGTNLLRTAFRATLRARAPRFAPATAAAAFAGFTVSTVLEKYAAAHCQVPCGIYDDSGRIASIQEDVVTITKAMNQIQSLAGKNDAQSLNQATRWVVTKEAHASKIIEVVSEYFLTQKVKDVSASDSNYPRYLKALATHHRVMRLAMKAKQSTDPKVASELAHEVSHLAHLYGK